MVLWETLEVSFYPKVKEKQIMQKNIIITGTSRGIGYELARQLAAAGHRILALSRNTKPMEELDEENIHYFPFDISKKEDRQKTVDFVKKNWGHLDILIHNAGQFLKGEFEEINLEEVRQVYETNVFGVYALTQNLLPLTQQNSHIVVISSMGGIQGSVKFPGLTAYSSSKAAVINLVEVLAEEYKETGPVFNALALGAVQTEMFEEAFPGAEASLQPKGMAEYIANFALNGNKVYNGKVLQVSNSTP